MPAAITHYQQALAVLKKCDIEHSPKFTDAFLCGAQGPDFLYYHNLFQPWRKNLRSLGSKLHHEHPAKLLSVIRDFLNQSGNEMIESYIYGFLCHYSLDRTAHPFVHWDVHALKNLYPGRSNSFLHNHVESVLDVIILRSVTGQLAVDFDLRKTVPKDREVQLQIEKLYRHIFERLYGIHGIRENVFQAMSHCRIICGFLNDRYMIKKPVAQALEQLTHKYVFSSVIRGMNEPDEFDYANVLHSEWKWPENNRDFRTDSFFELYAKSIQDSVTFIREFKTADLSQLTHEISFV
ncbi:MAG: Zn-dep-PLPC domain-containing protein [Oscillospiraceae bacterium]